MSNAAQKVVVLVNLHKFPTFKFAGVTRGLVVRSQQSELCRIRRIKIRKHGWWAEPLDDPSSQHKRRDIRYFHVRLRVSEYNIT